MNVVTTKGSIGELITGIFVLKPYTVKETMCAHTEANVSCSIQSSEGSTLSSPHHHHLQLSAPYGPWPPQGAFAWWLLSCCRRPIPYFKHESIQNLNTQTSFWVVLLVLFCELALPRDCSKKLTSTAHRSIPKSPKKIKPLLAADFSIVKTCKVVDICSRRKTTPNKGSPPKDKP